MKLVINTCYGGFRLSVAAVREVLGCPHVELIEPEKYYGGRPGWEQRFEQDKKRGEDTWGVILHEGKVIIDNHRDDDNRTCPRLVEVVERLGEAASSSLASLKVVTVPDGVDYEIDEYDGIEHIAETHRTWS